MKRNLCIAIITIEVLTIWWMLFGGGELNSPNLGLKAMLYIAEYIK